MSGSGHFSNKVIFITGASSGIGEALAREFCKQGGQVALIARRTNDLKKIEVELSAGGHHVKSYTCDVTAEEDLGKAVSSVKSDFGRIDIVVANAGFGVAGEFQRLNLADYRRQFETNVFGTLRTAYAVLEELKASCGQLVIIGSVSGHASLPGGSPYAMSKFALRALAQSLLIELRPLGIFVTLISPGFVASQLRQVNNYGKRNPNVADPVPAWLVMPTEKAAKQIVTAIRKKKAEAIVTWHGKWIVWISRFFPGTARRLLLMSGVKNRPEPKALADEPKS